jgi:NTP pyrophosphatase (non-canonical NTP hydrolase)
VAEDISELIHSLAERLERVSAAYAARSSVRRDDDWYVLKLQEELGELTQAWLRLTDRGRRAGSEGAALRSQVEDEAADLLCQLLLFARRFDIDLIASVRRKWLLFDRIPERPQRALLRGPAQTPQKAEAG